MNGYKPTIGIEFDDKYIDAKNKLMELIIALNNLTPAQREQLARECFASMGMTAVLEQFINNMNRGGRL